MQKNWYIVYTKAKTERKVATLLTKRKIENFCPLNCKQIKSSRKNKILYEPLFDSYVFVNISEHEIPLVTKVENVVSVVFWKGQPAKIKNEEIAAIKEFINDYQDIKLERTNVNVYGEAKIIDDTFYTMNGIILTVKNRSFHVNLPSIGYTMIAEMEIDSNKSRTISFGNRELIFQS